MNTQIILRYWLVATVGFTMACDGMLSTSFQEVEHGGEDDTLSAPVDPDEPFDPTRPVDPDVCAEQEPALARVPTRIMTSEELNNALGVLFEGLDFEPVSMTYDSRVGSFLLNARESVSSSHVSDFRLVAESVAADAATASDTLAPCDDPDDKSAAMGCAEVFVTDFGEKAFRRPLKPQEKMGLMELFEAGYDEAGYGEGLKYVFEATLQAPSFMYIHEEFEPGVSEISDHEIAQRMAGMVWRSIPDERLMDRARSGELSDPTVRREEVERMLEDPRAPDALRSLVMQWVGIDQLDAQAFAQQEDNAELVASMLGETRRFVDDVMDQSGSYTEILGARYTVVDQRMADHYGIDTTGVDPQDGAYRVQLADRAGVLTHASFLALQHGPVHRGLAIRKAVLCGIVPGPVGVDTEAIPTAPDESERSKSEKRLASESCMGCHRMMDPLGLPFEEFGELGASRIEDKHGNSVVGTGEVFATSDIDGPVGDAVDLVENLAQSDDVRTCVASHLFTWSYARVPSRADACLVQDISRTLDDTGGDLRQAMVEIIAAESFVRRVGGEQ